MLTESVRSLTVDGLSYAYRTVRTGTATAEPLVALGGAFQGMYDWAQMEDALTDVADLVTTDLPGAGDSDLLRPEHGVELLDAALEAVVDDLGAERINLYGYSYGSVIAYRFAQHHPERCARLVLGGVPARVTDAAIARGRDAGRLVAAGDLEGFADGIAAEMFCLDESRYVHRRDLALRFFRRSLLRVARRPHGDYLLGHALGTHSNPVGGLTGVPALVFGGEHDTITTLEQQRDFASAIDGSHFLRVPDCDHMMMLERPDAAIALVTSFITDTPAPAHALSSVPRTARRDRRSRSAAPARPGPPGN
ncbi:alpha/beta fold hydrolase [Streptomyces sp. NPDC016845]|uniref:alpha/beta fold hydrolase n=1 Tax=Streptomyces sp. NPDC016845 TaxID=3364972 RepID=UPI00378E87BF